MEYMLCPEHQRPGWKLILFLCTCLLSLSSPTLAEPTDLGDSLFVKGFSFTGNTVISQAELKALTQPSVGRSLTLAGLEEIAANVAALYKQKGYTLATAYVPQQQIRFGVVTIAILEGRVGEISVTGNKHYSTEFIRSSFAQAMETTLSGTLRSSVRCFSSTSIQT
jgi:hemolysin activation/secretion protein